MTIRGRILGAVTLAVAGLSAVTATHAADTKPPPSATNGQQIAQRFCTNCHLVGPEQTAVATVGPPPFVTIANKPDQTAERIRNALIQPHPPMPDMQMSNTEMMDLIAYLQTMRKVGLPSLIPPQGEAKPTYPKPG